MFHIPSSTIYIDKSLEWNDPRFNFTLAHEISHFVLHRKVNAGILKEEKEGEITDTNRELILDHVHSEGRSPEHRGDGKDKEWEIVIRAI